MPEKNKWFDRKPKHDPPLRFSASAGVLWVDALQLLEDLTKLHDRKRLPDDTFKLFRQLCQMPPAHRLSRNLKIVLMLLAQGPINDIMSEGLTEEERLALLDLEHLGAPAQIKSTAQGLLSVSERQQLIDAAQEMYRDERMRRWGPQDE